MARLRKRSRRGIGEKYKGGRKPRPWLQSPLPSLHYSSYLYARHMALMEALMPYVLEDLRYRYEIAVAREQVNAHRKYLPKKADKPDIFLFALEVACRHMGIKIEQTVQEYIAKRQHEELEAVLFTREE